MGQECLVGGSRRAGEGKVRSVRLTWGKRVGARDLETAGCTRPGEDSPILMRPYGKFNVCIGNCYLPS